MNWEAIGALAELAGAAAVVITLIYLTVQLRQNSTLMRRSATSALREADNELTRILATDPAANHIFWEGLEGRSDLSERDRRIFDPLVTLMTTSWREAVDLEGADYLSDHILSGADWLFGKRGFHEWWLEYRGTYEAELVIVIDRKFAAHAADV